MSATLSQLLLVADLVERGLVSAAKIRAMQESGITDEQMLAELESLKRTHERHQSLDLRDDR